MTAPVPNRFATGGALKGKLGQQLLDRRAPSHAVPTGTRIGAFAVVEQIGSGGMGAVFRGVRVVGGFAQTVAIKLMLASDGISRERFRAEMDILASLRHPHIAQLIDGGESEDGLLYLAMEHVEGIPIDQYCEQQHLDTRARVRLLLTIADALAHAHRNLVIHRDIKPNNILVGTADGRPHLLDFGIAKLLGEPTDRSLTLPGYGPMTPTYAAPEQFRGEAVTVATDVYQFGVLMYRLLSGGLPYSCEQSDPVAWARSVLDDEPRSLRSAHGARPPGLFRGGHKDDRDLDAIVQTALRKDPASRYGSMHALSTDLLAFLDGRPVSARHGGNWYRLARFAARHRWAVLGSSLAVLSLLAATTVAVTQAHQARREATRLHASVALLDSMLQAADVSSGHGGKRSLEDLLGVAAEDVQSTLKEHPDLRSGVLSKVADAYVGMGLPARAAPLYALVIADLEAQGIGGLPYAQALERGALAAYWNGDTVSAQRWLDQATAIATGPDDDNATVRDGLYFARWQMLRSAGRTEECFAAAAASVRNAELASPAIRDVLLQRALVRRGTSATDLQRFDDAERDLTEAVALGRRLFGDQHAAVLKAEQALGWHHASRGDYAKGLAILEPVGQRVLEVFGARSQEWARNLFNRGNIHVGLGQWEQAIRVYLESGRVYRESASPAIAMGALVNAAGLLREHGRCDEALPVYADIEQIWQTVQLRHPIFRSIYADIASCELQTGQLASARAHFERSRALYTPTEPELAEVLAIGADVAEAEGKREEAVHLLTQAISLHAADAVHAELVAQWRARADRLRAGASPPEDAGRPKI